MNIKGKAKEMEREKMLKYCSRSFLSGGARKSDIYGWIGCSQSQTRMTAENGAGLTWDDFARIFNSDQWAPCISLYRSLIRLYLHRYHCTISFIAIGSKWLELSILAEGSFFFPFDILNA